MVHRPVLALPNHVKPVASLLLFTDTCIPGQGCRLRKVFRQRQSLPHDPRQLCWRNTIVATETDSYGLTEQYEDRKRLPFNAVQFVFGLVLLD